MSARDAFKKAEEITAQLGSDRKFPSFPLEQPTVTKKFFASHRKPTSSAFRLTRKCVINHLVGDFGREVDVWGRTPMPRTRTSGGCGGDRGNVSNNLTNQGRVQGLVMARTRGSDYVVGTMSWRRVSVRGWGKCGDFGRIEIVWWGTLHDDWPRRFGGATAS